MCVICWQKNRRLQKIEVNNVSPFRLAKVVLYVKYFINWSCIFKRYSSEDQAIWLQTPGFIRGSIGGVAFFNSLI
jgi:hypothetical protein